jgi:hypothetical protein
MRNSACPGGMAIGWREFCQGRIHFRQAVTRYNPLILSVMDAFQNGERPIVTNVGLYDRRDQHAGI